MWKWQYVDAMIVALAQFTRFLLMAELGGTQLLSELLYTLELLRALQTKHITGEGFPGIQVRVLPQPPWEPRPIEWVVEKAASLLHQTQGFVEKWKAKQISMVKPRR